MIVHILMGARGYLCQRYAYTEGSAHAVPDYVISAYEKLLGSGLFRKSAARNETLDTTAAKRSPELWRKRRMATTGANPFALEGNTISLPAGRAASARARAAACAALGAKLILADIADAAPVAEKLRGEGRAATSSVMRRRPTAPPSSG